ncbi:MAG: hypothetical protein K2X32_09645 [Phycisphaerales bacterium]|nr:hypothetical protein [Phycisphaerales bacterium]
MSTRLQLAQSIAQSPAKASLEDLRRLCERAGGTGERGDSGGRGDGVLVTGWAEIDQVLPSRGLDTARLHEWVGVMPSADGTHETSAGASGGGVRRQSARVWTPALSVLSHLVGRVVQQTPHRQVLWIGERVWPCPLSMDEAVLRRSVFVRATKWFERLWAADLALRSGAAGAVIVDAGGMDLSATRRLQLAAESGGEGGGGGGGDGQGGLPDRQAALGALAVDRFDNAMVRVACRGQSQRRFRTSRATMERRAVALQRSATRDGGATPLDSGARPCEPWPCGCPRSRRTW